MVVLPSDDEDLGELPPLDGDGDEPDAGEGSDDEDTLEGEASLDDGTGEGDPVDTEGLDLTEGEAGWLDEANDASGVDLGEAPIDDLGAQALSADDAEEPGVGEEDFGLGAGEERPGLDAGDEGPTDPDEELREADLPALGAGDDDEADDLHVVDASFAVDDPLAPAWAATPWERVGAPLPIARATAVGCAGSFALVAGHAEGGPPELARVDLEGASHPLAAVGLPVGEVRALAGRGLAIAAATEQGVLVSSDGGATFASTDGIAIDVAPLVDRVTEMDATGVLDAASPAVGARRGGVQVFASRTGGVVRDLGDGTWRVQSWPGAVTAVVLLDDDGTLIAASYSEAEDSTSLVRVDPSGRPAIVARVGATRSDPDSDGRVASMAFDEARGVVWVAGGFGVASFAVQG